MCLSYPPKKGLKYAFYTTNQDDDVYVHVWEAEESLIADDETAVLLPDMKKGVVVAMDGMDVVREVDKMVYKALDEVIVVYNLMGSRSHVFSSSITICFLIGVAK